MRLEKKLIFMTTFTVAMSVAICGCNKKDKKEETTTKTVVQETTTKEMTHNIAYESDGDAVTDSKVFGENVFVFSPEDDPSEVNEKVNTIYKRQESNQFGTNRYSLLFKPGTYDSSIEVNVGYYTQVSGLGIVPTDTNIEKLWCNADWMRHNATCNFWRSAENFSANQYTMWATSQAVSFRRMQLNDGIVLSDGQGWSSGGFMADCFINGRVSSGSQQQWLSRNDFWRFWEGGVWNMVFVGIDMNRVPGGTWPGMPYTKVEKTEVIQEKPFLTYDNEHGYGLFVPEIRKDAVNTSWQEGATGTFISLNKFYIANPKKDNADTLNEAIASGKHILLTPGIYEIDKTIKIDKENTIIYGMGLATLVAANGNITAEVGDVDGVKICGVIFEAGNKESDTLLLVGSKKTGTSHEASPICLSDVYFRVGGSDDYIGKVKNCITINSNNIIGDNLWVWRADHGANVAWDSNTAKNGIIVNGDDVIMYGLFVEHFQEYQTIWNGNNGRVYFYQSEIPYDVPNQESFMSHDGKVNGYASYKVGDDVTSHEAWGLGVYSYNRDARIDINSAAEVPDRKGVKIHNICSVMLTGNPGISHVINDVGMSVNYGGARAIIREYENGEVK